jgi:hypothetical protein
MASLNAGPEYYAAERRYGEAKNLEEKIVALEDMIRLAPKHKAAEDLLRDLRGKLARFRKELARQQATRRASRRGGGGDFVRRQGAAQVVLLGFANSGKTALFNALTGLREPSTGTPHETGEIRPGMMDVDRAQIQVLDTPSLTKENESLLLGLARNADLTLAVLDPDRAEEQRGFFRGKEAGFLYGRLVLYASRAPLPGALRYEAQDPTSVEALRRALYARLDLVRVFTKAPHEREPNRERPLVLRRGATVADAAKEIHKELAQGLEYARVWGSAKFPGQRVSPDYELRDGDVVELHLRG